MTTAHNIDDYTEPYHAFHNHPSDKSFSFPDIRGMVLRKNMLSLTAQGNAGSKYVMLRRKNCDSDGYYLYLCKKSKETLYSSSATNFTLDYIHDKNREVEIKTLIALLPDSDKEALYSAVRKITDVVCSGCGIMTQRFYACVEECAMQQAIKRIRARR